MRARIRDDWEYGYGPSARTPGEKVGTFIQAQYDEAKPRNLGINPNLFRLYPAQPEPTKSSATQSRW